MNVLLIIVPEWEVVLFADTLQEIVMTITHVLLTLAIHHLDALTQHTSAAITTCVPKTLVIHKLVVCSQKFHLIENLMLALKDIVMLY
jgi:hypothetical protein